MFRERSNNAACVYIMTHSFILNWNTIQSILFKGLPISHSVSSKSYDSKYNVVSAVIISKQFILKQVLERLFTPAL